MRTSGIHRVSGSGHASAIRRVAAVCVVVGGLTGTSPVSAAESCYGMSPGFDGVLRLDTGRGVAWPCSPRSARGYRAYNALPEAFEMKAARRRGEPRTVLKSPSENDGKSDLKSDLKSDPKGTAKADVKPEAGSGPALARVDSNPPLDNRTTKDSVKDEELLRLRGETARLKDEMARLRDETSRLRGETTRLKDQFALREATTPGRTENSKTDAVRTDTTRTDIGKPATNKTEAGKIDGKIAEPLPRSDPPRTVSETSGKGDLLSAEPHSSEIAKSAPEKKAEAQLPDEQAFERQKGVVERAWKQLIDLAARMKGDVPGKPQ